MVVLSCVGGKAQELQFMMNVIGVPQLDVSEVRVKFYLILLTLEIPNLDAFTVTHELRMALHDRSQLVVERRREYREYMAKNQSVQLVGFATKRIILILYLIPICKIITYLLNKMHLVNLVTM